jgi:acetyltransferase-like isoleucine patch superfamily enzyme
MTHSLCSFFPRLAFFLSSRWYSLGFRLRSLGGRIRHDGRITLNVPLICDGFGRVSLGSDISIGYRLAAKLGDGQVRFQARSAGARISIGGGTSFSNNVQLFAEQSITIGARCLIGDAVLILDSDFHDLSAAGRHSRPAITAPVVLEDNVFVGSRVIILKGVTIGKDSVIGAGSVVVRSIPPGVIAAGNPAKVIRNL